MMIASQDAQQITFGDQPWYANRGTPFLQGERDSLYVYNLSYPVMVAVVHSILGDTAIASIITNVLSAALVILFTAALGRLLFSRRIGLMAGLLMGTLPAFLSASRLIQADTFFLAHLLASALLCLLLIRQPSLLVAAILGLVLGLFPFTRFEGVMYALLIPLASFCLWRAGHGLRRALMLGVVATVPFVILLFAYLSVLGESVIGENAESGIAFALFRTIWLTPFRFDMVSMRLGEGLTEMIDNFPLAGWLLTGIALFTSLGGTRRERRTVLLLALLPAYNFAYTFTLSGYPTWTYLIHFLPFLCILLAWAICSLGERVALRMALPARIVRHTPTVLAALLIVWGVIAGVQSIQSAPFAFQNSLERQSVQRLDTWLQEQYPDRPTVYTFCPRLALFSTSDIYYLYRLAANFNRADVWNSPLPLAGRMRADEGLLIVCENPIYYDDWREVLLPPEGLNTLYEQVAVIEEYSIYRAR